MYTRSEYKSQIKYMRIQRLFREELWFLEVIYCWTNLPFSGTVDNWVGELPSLVYCWWRNARDLSQYAPLKFNIRR